MCNYSEFVLETGIRKGRQQPLQTKKAHHCFPKFKRQSVKNYALSP